QNGRSLHFSRGGVTKEDRASDFRRAHSRGSAADGENRIHLATLAPTARFRLVKTVRDNVAHLCALARTRTPAEHPVSHGYNAQLIPKKVHPRQQSSTCRILPRS